MGVEQKKLQGFLGTVRRVWLNRIQKAAYCTVQEMTPTDAGVRVVVTWTNKKGDGRWEKTYPLDHFFGHTMRLSWEAREILRRPCDFSNDVIKDVLSQRGAL